MLGGSHRRHPLDRQIHLTLVRWYKQHRLAGIERQARSHPAVRAVRLAHAAGVQAVLPRKPAAGLVAQAVARAHGLL
jgi:hypothetical protein